MAVPLFYWICLQQDNNSEEDESAAQVQEDRSGMVATVRYILVK